MENRLWGSLDPIFTQVFGDDASTDPGSGWIHRAFHALPLLWRLHRTHHSNEQMGARSSRRRSLAVGWGRAWGLTHPCRKMISPRA